MLYTMDIKQGVVMNEEDSVDVPVEQREFTFTFTATENLHTNDHLPIDMSKFFPED